MRAAPLLLMLIALDAPAIVRRHDRDDARYRALARGLASVADMNLPGGTGTLIAPRWVLTAAHVVALIKMPHEIIAGGERIPVRRVIAYPRGGVGRDDIALVELSRAVHGVEPAPLYTLRDETSHEIVIAGRGFTGDGTRGAADRDRVFRAATNVVDRVSTQWLVFRFDAPPAGTDLEGISGPGDSGGPAFIVRDGRHFLAGVSSAQDDRGVAREGMYGVTEYYARVSSYLDWIERTMHDTAIVGATLVDVRGGPSVRNATVVVSGEWIVAAGANVPIPAGAKVVDACGLWILPGLIDSHVHIGAEDDFAAWTRAGVTTLVDNGSRIPPDTLKERVAGGPRVFASGPILTANGGYPAAGVVSSPARFIAEPRTDVVDLITRQHVDFVKIAIERGFLADYEDDGWPVPDVQAIAAIADEAHARGKLVRAHVTQPKELAIAIDAGVDVIAHTPFVELPGDLLERAAKRGTIFVSTIALWTDPKLIATAASNLARYVARGGRIAVGSDYPNFPRRGVLEEIRLLEKAGIAQLEILRALTIHGAAAIGQETNLGTIEAGRLADLILVAGDPAKSVEALGDVVFVMRDGEILVRSIP